LSLVERAGGNGKSDQFEAQTPHLSNWDIPNQTPELPVLRAPLQPNESH
jgi:hypothetical protein